MINELSYSIKDQRKKKTLKYDMTEIATLISQEFSNPGKITSFSNDQFSMLVKNLLQVLVPA